MEPFTLRCFVAVARSGSFSRAADELYRTQPAISLQVRKLERELDRPLFDRARRSPVMTEAGRALYAGARDLLERLDRLPELAAPPGAEPGGTLTIASNLSLISHFLPRAVREFHGRYPRVRLRFLNRTSHGVGRSIEEGDADLGIGFLIEERTEMESAVLFRSPLVLVTARASKVSPRGLRGGVLSLDKVLAGPVIHFEEGVDLRRFVERALAGRRSLEPVIELPSIDLIIQFVNSGFGSTILPAFAISESWRKRLVVKGLGRSIEPLEVRSCRSRQRTLSRAAAAFLDLLRPLAKSTGVIRRSAAALPIVPRG
jgi:DNA-binding transcriptional LysR family regulator